MSQPAAERKTLEIPAEAFVARYCIGLAKTGDNSLTNTGDIVGTLRYMAPERFQGECAERTDVYGLGLTLYGLLVPRPAFGEFDRLRLIDRPKNEEPRRARLLDSRIPRNLETIVLKAIDKEPKRSPRAQQGEAAAFDLFFLALCHHRLGDAAKAKDCHQRGKQLFQAHKGDLSTEWVQELTAFQAESESVLTQPPGQVKK